MRLSAAQLRALYYWSLAPAERCRGELDGGSARTWEVLIAKGLLERSVVSPRRDILVPTTEGWRLLIAEYYRLKG